VNYWTISGEISGEIVVEACSEPKRWINTIG